MYIWLPLIYHTQTESTAALKSVRRETCTPGGVSNGIISIFIPILMGDRQVWMAVTDVERHKSPKSCGDSALEQELNDAKVVEARKVRIKVAHSTSFATAPPMPPPL